MNVESQNGPSKIFETNESKFNASGSTEDLGDVVAEKSEDQSLSGKIEALEDELKETKDKFMRTLADMENMRRRHEKERGDLLKYATEKLLQDILPVLDSFEKAMLASPSSDTNALIDGVKMIHKKFLHVLENHGLKQVDAVGQDFDPNLHQAIQRLEDENIASEIVKEEFQKGYILNGRLVRPSMVSVCVPKPISSGE